MTSFATVASGYEPLLDNIYKIDFCAKAKENSVITGLIRRVAAAVLAAQLINRIIPETIDLFRNWSVKKESAPLLALQWTLGIILLSYGTTSVRSGC